MKLDHELVIDEISRCLDTSDYSELDDFISHILSSKKVITYGAGRVGLVMQGFAKRLGHLGKSSFYLEDSTVPNTSQGDLLIIGSGSGSTASVVTFAKIASQFSLKIILVTANKDSELHNLSTSTIFLNAPSKVQYPTSSAISKQPMTSLFEQSLMLFCDSLVLTLMEQMGETEDSMKARHNVIE